MTPFWQRVSNFEQREQKYAEAALLQFAANGLSSNEKQIEAFVDTAAPQGVAAVIGAVEKADSHVPESTFINAVISEGQTSIDAELQPLVAQGGALIPKVVAAIQAAAAKLQAEAAAL